MFHGRVRGNLSQGLVQGRRARQVSDNSLIMAKTHVCSPSLQSWERNPHRHRACLPLPCSPLVYQNTHPFLRPWPLTGSGQHRPSQTSHLRSKFQLGQGSTPTPGVSRLAENRKTIPECLLHSHLCSHWPAGPRALFLKTK